MGLFVFYQSYHEKAAAKTRKGLGISQHPVLGWERTRIWFSWAGTEGLVLEKLGSRR